MAEAPTASTIEHEFDVATAVRPAEAAGAYDVDVDAGFTVGPKPNGGYLLACIARAADNALTSRGSTHHHALAATAHYLGAPDPGPASIEVEVLRLDRQRNDLLLQALQITLDVLRLAAQLELECILQNQRQ